LKTYKDNTTNKDYQNYEIKIPVEENCSECADSDEEEASLLPELNIEECQIENPQMDVTLKEANTHQSQIKDKLPSNKDELKPNILLSDPAADSDTDDELNS
jgi:hypothetical protein